MKRQIIYFTILFAIIVPGVFYVGYMANKKRVFPLRPFVKRTLIELGVSETTLGFLRKGKLPELQREINSINIDSAYYPFKGKIYDLPTNFRYGSIKEFGNGLIFVDGQGFIWYFESGQFKTLRSKKIPNIYGLNETNINDVDVSFAVVKDISIEKNYIYASAIGYIVSRECVNLSVFRIKYSVDANNNLEFGKWNKIFNTEPCIKAYAEDEATIMIEAGGRIIKVSDEEILFSVGAFGKDGVNGKNHSQDSESHYGKMIKLNLSTLTPKIFTSGHRNPQGLLLTPNGSIFSTEHGPQGGDELNLIVKGRNYGWPLVTFGTKYGEYAWPLDNGLKDHSGFEKPIYSWVPSIGVSNLIEVKNTSLPYWNGDLLVSSLFAVSLYRVKLNGMSPIVVEKIYIGSRIREIINYRNGFALLIDQEDKLIIMERRS